MSRSGGTDWVKRVLGVVRALVTRKRLDADLDDELRLHIELETEKNVRAGMEPAEARRRALVAFGGVERYREATRDARGVRGLEDVGRDLRYAVRGLMRRPGFTFAAVLTLALAIGANTAVFSAVNSLILHPLPFKDGNRIVYGWVTYPKSGVMVMAEPAVVDAWLTQSHSFAATTTYASGTVALGAGADSTDVGVDYIGADYLHFLDLRPVLGRGFTAAETAAGGPDVALLGYGEWKSRYGGSHDVLGRQLDLGGRPYTVVGVAPPKAGYLHSEPADADFFLPLRRGAVLARDSAAPTYIRMAGRLGPGVTVEQAERELTAIMARVKDTRMRLDGWQAKLMRQTDFLGDSLHTTLLVLMGAVALVLLIACANIGSLLLARGGARAREMAVRTTLGAGRGRLIRQLLTESMLLALAGGGLGVLLAEWGLHVLARTRPESLSNLDAVTIDHRALLFTAGVVVLTTLLFGLYPALRASGSAPASELKGGMAGEDVRRLRLRAPMTVVEVALSVVLLVGAGLLVRTLFTLEHHDPGFRAEGLAAATFQYPKDRYPDEPSKQAFVDAVVARAQRLPGVTGATVAAQIPLNYVFMTGRLEVEGRAADSDAGQGMKSGAWVPPDYFKVLGIPLVEGHTFSSAPGDRDQRVMIVSRSLAHAMVADGQSVLGMHVRTSGQKDWSTVIGVVGDVAAESVRGGAGDRYQLYFPFDPGLFPWPQTLIVRTTGDARALAANLRTVIHATDPDMDVAKLRTAREMIHSSLSSPRFYATTLTGFALLALLLAAVGLFGVLSYGVQRRRHEIAVRVAMGASIGDVRANVVRQALVPVVIGLGVGIALSAAATQVLTSLLFGIGRMDPTTIAAVGIVVLFTALLASYLPARRATRVDPMVTLRAE
ncbi:MAG: ABC transporter permease [Gemmatimonadota bacterium]